MNASDLERFRRLCGLLGSDQMGERAAAALKCCEFLGQHGLSWSDVLLPLPAEPAEAIPPDELLRRRREEQKASYKARWARTEPDADGFWSDGRK